MGIHRTDDPVADFNAWDAEQESWLARRPVCADCGHNIQDEKAYYINGEWICKKCMSTYFVDVEDYIG